MKILLFDIETTPNLSWTWGKYEQDVIKFKDEGHLLCFAYKWLGQNIRFVSERTHGKKGVVKELYKLFNEADVVIAHNGDSFDIKMSRKFFVRHGLPPHKPFISIDTKKLAKRYFRFNSNKLDDLGEYLGLGRKVETGGMDLWFKCMEGDRQAWRLMEKYNRMDVELLEKVYLKLRSWDSTIHIINVNNKTCPSCGSTKVQKRGFDFNNGFKYQRFQCSSCGRWSRGNNIERIIDKENLLK